MLAALLAERLRVERAKSLDTLSLFPRRISIDTIRSLGLSASEEWAYRTLSKHAGTSISWVAKKETRVEDCWIKIVSKGTSVSPPIASK